MDRWLLQCAINKCDRPPCSLSHRRRRISEYMFITACSMHDHDEEKRREQMCAAVNLKRNLSLTHCTIEATDRHRASRDFLYCLVLMRFYVCLLCLCQSRLVGDIMLSSCQPVYSSVCPTSVRPFVRLLWTWYFENEWTYFDVSWYKWSTGQRHETCPLWRSEVKITRSQR